MKKATIAIDVDDVLADNAAGFVAFTNRKWGTHLTVDDYDEHWAKVWQVDYEEVERRASQYLSEEPRHFAHDETALPVLKKLSERFNLIIVTSRRMTMKQDTHDWLHTHYPGIFNDESIHFAGIWDNRIDESRFNATKRDVIETLGADYLIDDQLKHCLAVNEAGVKALLFGEYAWNKSDTLPPEITRVKDWLAIEEYFDGITS